MRGPELAAAREAGGRVCTQKTMTKMHLVIISGLITTFVPLSLALFSHMF